MPPTPAALAKDRLSKLVDTKARHALPPGEIEPDEPSRTIVARRFSIRHVVVVVGMIALVAFGVVFNTLSHTPAAVPVAPSPSVRTSTPTPTPSPSRSMIRVHVAGAVRQPSVVLLPEGAIVQDAIAAAGGFREDADPALLNLAATLTDGDQVVVGTQAEPAGQVRGGGPSGSSQTDGSTGGQLVNINTATAVELEALPGIGPVLAGSIVTWRETNGEFETVEELLEVSGIGEAVLAKLQPFVTV